MDLDFKKHLGLIILVPVIVILLLSLAIVVATPKRIAIYSFFRDFGSIIAGVFAFSAALVALVIQKKEIDNENIARKNSSLIKTKENIRELLKRLSENINRINIEETIVYMNEHPYSNDNDSDQKFKKKIAFFISERSKARLIFSEISFLLPKLNDKAVVECFEKYTEYLGSVEHLK